MENATAAKPGDKGSRRRRRGKVVPRVAVEDQVLKAEVPAGARFKGCQDFVVQDLELRVQAIRYRRERCVAPDGRMDSFSPMLFPVLRPRPVWRRPRCPA